MLLFFNMVLVEWVLLMWHVPLSSQELPIFPTLSILINFIYNTLSISIFVFLYPAYFV